VQNEVAKQSNIFRFDLLFMQNLFNFCLNLSPLCGKQHHFAWFGLYRKGLQGALEGEHNPNKKLEQSFNA
jgi:hypothetical protein